MNIRNICDDRSFYMISELYKATINPIIDAANRNYHINLMNTMYWRMYNASMDMKRIPVNTMAYYAAHQEYIGNYQTYQRLYAHYPPSFIPYYTQPFVPNNYTVQPPAHFYGNTGLSNPSYEGGAQETGRQDNNAEDNNAEDNNAEENNAEENNAEDNDAEDNDADTSGDDTSSNHSNSKSSESMKTDDPKDDEDMSTDSDELLDDAASLQSSSESTLPLMTDDRDDADTIIDSDDAMEDSGYLWLSNVSSSAKANDISNLFNIFGHVIKVKLFENPQSSLPSSSFVLVSMSNPDAAENAMNALQSYPFFGMNLSIKRLVSDPLSSPSISSNIDDDEKDISDTGMVDCDFENVEN